jgi:hypothetical protein
MIARFSRKLRQVPHLGKSFAVSGKMKRLFKQFTMFCPISDGSSLKVTGRFNIGQNRRLDRKIKALSLRSTARQPGKKQGPLQRLSL